MFARNFLIPIQLFLVLAGYPAFAEMSWYELFAEPDVRQTEPDDRVALSAGQAEHSAQGPYGAIRIPIPDGQQRRLHDTPVRHWTTFDQ